MIDEFKWMMDMLEGRLIQVSSNQKNDQPREAELNDQRRSVEDL